MHRSGLFLLLCLSLCQALHAQTPAGRPTHALSGFVRDTKTGQPIPGANVFLQETRRGTTTDKAGFFVISVIEGTHSIRISHIGWTPKVQPIKVDKVTLLNVTLDEDAHDLSEVVVTSELPDRNVKKVELGVSTLTIKSIKRIPAFMGEVDVVRSLLLLPGVTTVGEGATGINVRGGSIDQNLMLLDDAPVFNSSHLLGFFSVYNPDVVRDATLHRGGIASSYGGRASSILDVKIREPEAEKWVASGGIGLVSSRLGVEGPLINKKFFVLAATRLSFNDFLFKLGPTALQGTKANFSDVTTKLKYLFNEHHSLSFTGYVGKDVFKLPSDSLSSVEVNASSTQFNYRSLAGTLRWNYFISARFNLATSAIWSDYQVVTSAPDPVNAFRLTADVQQRQLKSDLSIHTAEAHHVQTGVSLIDYYVQPNRLVPGPASNVLPVTLATERGYELAAYVQDEWVLNPKLSVQGGLRYSAFMNRGAAEVRTYAEERTPEHVISTRQYGSGTLYNPVGGLEPRLSLRYNLSEGQSIKLGYNRMRQYIQLVTNTTAALPTSRWLLANPYIKPQISDQVSVGYFQNTTDNAIEASAEVYAKTLQNAIDYKDGAQLQLNQTPETDLLQGRGRAYGFETMLRKNKGLWTGWVSYTFSRTFLTLNGPRADERINGGTAYPANYDKPHNLNAMVVYRPSLRFSMSFNFTYSSGRPLTQPYARAYINGVYIPIYVNRNQERIPDYHRLDFAMNFEPDPQKARKSRFQSNWVFAIYNVYGHKNAYSVFYRLNAAADSDAYKLSIFGTMFPSLTYNFKF